MNIALLIDSTLNRFSPSQATNNCGKAQIIHFRHNNQNTISTPQPVNP